MKKFILRKNSPDWSKQQCIFCNKKIKLADVMFVRRNFCVEKGFWMCRDECKCRPDLNKERIATMDIYFITDKYQKKLNHVKQ